MSELNEDIINESLNYDVNIYVEDQLQVVGEVDTKCYDCGTMGMVQYIFRDKCIFRGKELIVDIEFTRCEKCKGEWVLTDQIKRNDERLLTAWSKACVK